jgi:single-strand DNA-binding protein
LPQGEPILGRPDNCPFTAGLGCQRPFRAVDVTPAARDGPGNPVPGARVAAARRPAPAPSRVPLRAARVGAGPGPTPPIGVTGGKERRQPKEAHHERSQSHRPRRQGSADPSGNGPVTLIVATDRVKLKDGKTYIDEATGYTAKTTEFHKVTCFNGQGKAAATRKKGDVVAISGYLHYSSWEDRDGNARYGAEVIADRLHFF